MQGIEEGTDLGGAGWGGHPGEALFHFLQSSNPAIPNTALLYWLLSLSLSTPHVFSSQAHISSQSLGASFAGLFLSEPTPAHLFS